MSAIAVRSLDISPRIDEVDPTCVLYLPLYKLPGEVFYSRDRNWRKCTNSGSLWTPQGRRFDGVDDRVNCGAVNYWDGGISVEMWTKIGSTITFAQNTRMLADALLFLMMNRSGGTTNDLAFVYSGAAEKDAKTTDYPRDVWIYIAGTYDKSDIKIYIEGVLKDSTPHTSAFIAALDNLWVGWDPRPSPGTAFNGPIGEVRVYNRALSPHEIYNRYLATRGRYGT